jgi:hypothetical protein
MASMAAGNALQELAEQHPTMDAIRYDWKNVKWTFEHVDYFSDALATGIVEAGIAPGDVVLSWLPQHFSEQASETQTYTISITRMYLLCSLKYLFLIIHHSSLFSLHVPRLG